MAISISDGIEREKQVIQSFFRENLDLEFYDLRHTYAQFRLRAVDGIPVNSKILLDFYDDKCYMPIDSPARKDYVGKLDVYIMGKLFPSKESCIGSHSIPFSHSAYRNRESNKLSIIDFVREASAYTFVRVNSVSGYLKKVNDPNYSQSCCMEHLGRKQPSLSAQIDAASSKVSESRSPSIKTNSIPGQGRGE